MISWKAWKNVSIHPLSSVLLVLFGENGFVILVIKEMEKLSDYTGIYSSSKYSLVRICALALEFQKCAKQPLMLPSKTLWSRPGKRDTDNQNHC